MNILPRLKKKLLDNLSLSTRLSLKGVWANATRALSALTGGLSRVVRPVRPPEIPHEPRSGTPADLVSAARELAVEIAAERRAAVIKTSIVIPVFNKAAFTLECLRSLARGIDLNEAEIIVVDDASTDETPKVLAELQNSIRVVTAPQNLGFGEACNRGAAVARGQYVVFLNNDTAVLPGWLKHLEETIEGDASVGAVGSMLMYANASIQEAGGIVWRDGRAHHYGGGESPDDRRFNFSREVDYCSAASLLIRKEIFEELGGFDRQFAPAYYEDVDLCFGVRSLGYKVIYQPMSRLVHYESVTARSKINTSIEKMQTGNRAKFVAKWSEVLNREHLSQNPKEIVKASNRNRGRKSVIVFDERVPSPDRDAGSLRMFIILKTLARNYHVVFIPFNRPQSIDYERALWKEGIETADAVEYRRLLKDRDVKVAIVSRPTMAEVFVHRIRRASSETRIIFDTVDLHFRRLHREYELSNKPDALAEAERELKLERRFAQESDVVWCASVEDKQALEREAPGTKIELVPTIHELRDAGQPFESRHDLLFIGNLAHRPNVDGVLFFLREVYPLLREKFPELKLDIIGDFPPAEVSAYHRDDVRVRGYVPDTEPFLHSRRVFVAPLRFGAGIKGKIGEAMSYGIPVVTTSIGAEGFGVTNEVELMIADDAGCFVDAIVQLYLQKELWERIATNSRLHIKKHFTPEVIAHTINRSIGDLER